MDFLLRYKEAMLLPALLAWLATGGKRPLWARWLGVQVIAAIVVEAVGMYTRARGSANHGIYNAYMVIEFATLWGVVASVPLNTKSIARLSAIGFAATVLVWVLDLSRKGSFAILSTNTLIIGGTLLALAACGAMYAFMRQTFSPLHREPLFWALLSIVAYFMCFVPVFGLYNHFSIRNEELAYKLLILNDWLFVLRYTLVCVSLVLMTRHARLGDARP